MAVVALILAVALGAALSYEARTGSLWRWLLARRDELRRVNAQPAAITELPAELTDEDLVWVRNQLALAGLPAPRHDIAGLMITQTPAGELRLSGTTGRGRITAETCRELTDQGVPCRPAITDRINETIARNFRGEILARRTHGDRR